MLPLPRQVPLDGLGDRRRNDRLPSTCGRPSIGSGHRARPPSSRTTSRRARPGAAIARRGELVTRRRTRTPHGAVVESAPIRSISSAVTVSAVRRGFVVFGDARARPPHRQPATQTTWPPRAAPSFKAGRRRGDRDDPARRPYAGGRGEVVLSDALDRMMGALPSEFPGSRRFPSPLRPAATAGARPEARGVASDGRPVSPVGNRASQRAEATCK